MMRGVATSLVALTIGAPAFCQDALGETYFAGRKIVLRDDGTWQYTADEPAMCTAIDTAISWCGTSERWSRKPNRVGDVDGIVFGDGKVGITSRHIWPAVSPQAIFVQIGRSENLSQLPTDDPETRIETPLGQAISYRMPSAASEDLIAILPLQASDLVLIVAGPKGTADSVLRDAASSFFEGVEVEPGLYLKAFGNG